MFRKILKILRYIPILWDDFEDDFPSYELKLLRYRLEKAKEQINPYVANKLMGVDETIEHIDNYLNSDETYEKISGGLSFPIELAVKGKTPVIVNGNTGKEFTEEEDKEFESYYKSQTAWEEKEWNSIWDTIKKYGETWWV